jgi:hypothetical protein
MNKAEKKLEPCDCKCTYCSKGICAFGLRHIGCFKDKGPARTMALTMGVKDEDQ